MFFPLSTLCLISEFPVPPMIFSILDICRTELELQPDASSCYAVQISNFNPKFEDKEMETALRIGFCWCGEIVNVTVSKSSNKRNKNAIMEFEEQAGVERALLLQGKVYACTPGRVLKVVRSNRVGRLPGPERGSVVNEDVMEFEQQEEEEDM